MKGPLKDGCLVLFAGPHFHAAMPLVRQELDRRGQDGLFSGGINLIHAPTRELLHQHGPAAHIAIPFMERFTEDFFHHDLTPNLRLVIQFGVGLEGVDVQAATRQGIAVSNIPADGTGNAQATSEHAIYLATSLLRYAIHDCPRRFREESLGGIPIPRTLYRKRVTVVGFGAVGSCLAHYLVTMGADVTVVRRKWPPSGNTQPEVTADSIKHSHGESFTTFLYSQIHKCTSLEEALPTTQVLILACTLTHETVHCINGRTIAMLPPGAIVVNVARGGLIEYGAMLEALTSGAIGGFASDVGIGHPTKPSEPWDPHDEISHLPNVLFTPHVGGYTDYSYSVMAKKVVDGIEHIIRGDPPPVWANKLDR